MSFKMLSPRMEQAAHTCDLQLKTSFIKQLLKSMGIFPLASTGFGPDEYIQTFTVCHLFPLWEYLIYAPGQLTALPQFPHIPLTPLAISTGQCEVSVLRSWSEVCSRVCCMLLCSTGFKEKMKGYVHVIKEQKSFRWQPWRLTLDASADEI